MIHVWGNRAGGNRQLLKQLVHRLRQKIEDDPADPRLVRNVPNAGYLLDPAAAPADARRTALSLIRHPEFRRGFSEMVAPSLGIAAWGLVTGVAMVKSGLSVPLAALMTVLVYAGSAQLAALPLLVAGAPLWVLWAAAFCVNLRFVIYSAHWRKYFGHLPRWQRLVARVLRGRSELRAVRAPLPGAAAAARSSCRISGAACIWNWASWQGASLLGVFVADRVPTEWGLGLPACSRCSASRTRCCRARRAGSRPAWRPARPSRRSACR